VNSQIFIEHFFYSDEEGFLRILSVKEQKACKFDIDILLSNKYVFSIVKEQAKLDNHIAEQARIDAEIKAKNAACKVTFMH